MIPHTPGAAIPLLGLCEQGQSAYKAALPLLD